MSYKKQILDRINSFDSDYVFISNDFLDITEYENIRKTLNRLVDSNEITRIMKGIYYKPKFIEIINEYKKPSINSIAEAIARKYNWTIAPSENTALNLLGLSTQVPAKWVYITDGRYAEFNFGKIKLEFKHRSNKDISKISTDTATIIQAIKALEKDKITEKEINFLRKKLTKNIKSNLLIEAKTTSAWIYRIINRICEE